MRILVHAALLAAVAAAPAPKPAQPIPTPTAGIEFPPNDAGGHAAAWFRAFNTGEPAMKRFLESRVAARALQRRSVASRLGSYREMRKNRGSVSPIRIAEFTASSVKVVARGERGGRFAITFRCEDAAPHGIVSLRIEDLPPEEGTPEGPGDAEYSGRFPQSDLPLDPWSPMDRGMPGPTGFPSVD